MSADSKPQKHKTLLDRFKAAIEEGHGAFPFSELLGFRLIEIERGHAVVELDAREHHHNPMGTLHGGVLATIADTSMGVAHSSMLGEGESSTTIELKINFVRPVWTGKLHAVGKVVKHGKTLTLLESDVLDEQGRLVARASSTCMTLRGEEAQGR